MVAGIGWQIGEFGHYPPTVWVGPVFGRLDADFTTESGQCRYTGIDRLDRDVEMVDGPARHRLGIVAVILRHRPVHPLGEVRQ
ncbi:hypothetical protein EEZ25_27635 [Micromonospora aurantiaca]|nr:hypothetical protein EEZ25_27635 [Micromonospora aurantiaca]